MSLALLALFLTLAPAALATNTSYVDGVNGNDANDCLSSLTACKTIGHAIALATNRDSIMVAPATYIENLTIRKSLKVIGSGANRTIVDGGGAGSVFTISDARAHVYLSNLTIRNGYGWNGGGINNSGTLTISNCTISGNTALAYTSGGGGIYTFVGSLTITNSTISNNVITTGEGGGLGGGILLDNSTAIISKTTVRGNAAYVGGGIYGYQSSLTIVNSTVSNNGPSFDSGGIYSLQNSLTIINSTISNNVGSGYGDNIESLEDVITIQNTIVAYPSKRNCYVDNAIASEGYNLSSDDTCPFSGPGDMNNTDPNLSPLGSYGGFTQTVGLRNGSPAIDAGNPNGCTDGSGNLLKTDQRGAPRPDPEDTGGCDIGAFERQRN
jgi:hypothetical protein